MPTKHIYILKNILKADCMRRASMPNILSPFYYVAALPIKFFARTSVNKLQEESRSLKE